MTFRTGRAPSMHPAQASPDGVGVGRGVGRLRLRQSACMRRGSASPVVPAAGIVIMVIATRLAISHRSQSLGFVAGPWRREASRCRRGSGRPGL